MRQTLIISVLAVSTGLIVAEEPNSLQASLATLVALDGTNYVHARDVFVLSNNNDVDQLLNITVRTNHSWQTRAMAGIIGEYVQRKNDIRALVEKDWSADPEYNKDWDRRRAGPGPGLVPLVLKCYKEQKLWFFLLEQVWKDTNEITGNRLMYGDVWRGMARTACNESPVYDLMLIVVAERIRKDVGFKKHERWSELDFLLDSTTNTALPALLELLPVVPTEQRELKLLTVVDRLAQPEDAPMIEKSFTDKGQEVPENLRGPLNDLKERLKKKTEKQDL